MGRTTRKGIIGAAIIAAILVVAAAAILSSRPARPYDRAFDTRVADPAYRDSGPLVLYDEAHRNTHAADGAYKPFADLIQSDGHRFQVIREPLTTRTLTGASVLVIVGARGANDANDDPAFSDSEAAAIEQWIRAGGSLLLVTDHWPYGSAAASLAERLGVRMGKGLVEDPEHHDPTLGASHLVFASGNGLLRDHPIVSGRSPDERVDRVLTFTGQSILGPSGAVPFMALSDVAVEYPPTQPRVEKSGGDVRVNMEYGEPGPARGRAQGIALELGKGRIVILGDAGMLRAQRERGGMRVGMNVPGYDNRQLALNIMRWLSRIL